MIQIMVMADIVSLVLSESKYDVSYVKNSPLIGRQY